MLFLIEIIENFKILMDLNFIKLVLNYLKNIDSLWLMFFPG